MSTESDGNYHIRSSNDFQHDSDGQTLFEHVSCFHVLTGTCHPTCQHITFKQNTVYPHGSKYKLYASTPHFKDKYCILFSHIQLLTPLNSNPPPHNAK